jgi:hypothetical protein
MPGIENHAGFTISSTKLQVVEIIYKDGKFILETVDEAYFSEPLFLGNDKETKISALLQGAFNELLIKKPLKSSTVSFTLPFELFNIIQIPYDNTLLYQDLIEEFRWELSVLYPYSVIKDFVIQYIDVEKNNIINYNSAIVIGIERKFLKIINNFCRDNNLHLKFVDNVHLASERALSLSNPLNGRGIVLSVYFTTKNLSILYTYGSKPIYFNVIPLSDAGEIPALLLSETSGRNTFDMKRDLIEKAFITGDEISDTVIKTLRNTLEIDFTKFNPFEKIKPNPELFDNKYYSEKYYSFSPATGVAIRIA